MNLANFPGHAPLAVQTRGQLVESVHYGSLAALDPHGTTVLTRGEPGARIYPRSALKPLFAVAMVRAGLELPAEQLALAAASHSGSADHQDLAAKILAEAGLDPAALRNSTDLPYGTAERHAWIHAGNGPTQLAQNCSGKHAAMLAACVLNGWDTDTYLHHDHPLPTLIRAVVAELTGEDVTITSTDGCGTEVFALSLTGMARAFSRLVTATGGTAERRVADAMRAHPLMVAGIGRDVTALMEAVPGLLAKDGFEGIQLIALPDGSAVALKISDGSDRARMPAAVPALLALGVAPGPLEPFNNLPVLGGGHPVGTLSGLPLS
ncbi:asparaginase [Arthrobacter sp. UCD-GKA]|uniref:asparaginase n=1 Tax=Arthrobacter sp. UCD-GKA TaxID=1913576 RepID=UPI0008DCEBF6|nr:asparaginase [Arthrobacter sp. UCD-GKA]OIH85641.1 asparaginase [Arthrobacter sp. UCD-GKA]